MQMAPSFFKILLDPSSPHLPLPPAFVSRHFKNKIPKDPILRSAIGAYSWRLKIKEIGGSYCFTDGWTNVVEDTRLGYGDFIVFWLLDQSTFRVSFFGPNGCEKDLPSKIKVEEEEEEDDDYDGGGGVHVVLDEDEVEEDDEEEDNEDDDDDEEEEEEEEDDEEDDDDVVVDDDDDEDDEGEDHDDDDGDIDGDDGDPFFMTIFSKTHKTMLRLPAEFMRLAGIADESSITLKNLDGEEWRTGLRSEDLKAGLRYYLSTGWSNFWRSNELSEGDECVFKFIREEGKLCLAKVTKKRVPATPAKKPVGEIPMTEVAKREIGRPPRARGSCVDVESNKVAETPARQPVGEIPATEVVKRERGGSCVDVESNKVAETPARQPVGKIPATEVVESEDDCVEVVKRPRGRPPKQKSRVIYF